MNNMIKKIIFYALFVIILSSTASTFSTKTKAEEVYNRHTHARTTT